MVPKEKRSKPIFVHSALDDYGLTPIEFRAYARIARRQDDDRNGRPCDESIPNMARGLGVSGKTMTRALQVLAAAGLVSERERSGYTTERRITPLVDWKPKNDLKKIRKKIYKQTTRTPDISAGGGSVSRPDTKALTVRTLRTGEVSPPKQGVPPPPRRDEGYPSEGIPEEGNPTKAIPHTHSAPIPVDGVNNNGEDRVCVPLFDDEGDEENPWETERPHARHEVTRYVRWCIDRLGHDIRNPVGLVNSILKRRDPADYYRIESILMDIKLERELEEEGRAQAAADAAQRQKELDEWQQREQARQAAQQAAQLEEEERRRQREIEEAPAREQARLEAEAKREAEAAKAKAEAEALKQRIREQAAQRKKSIAA